MFLFLLEKAETKSQLETLPTTTNSFTDFVVLLVIKRVIQEEQSLYWEVTELVIVRKKYSYEHGLILNGF